MTDFLILNGAGDY